ncbi:MAG: thioredoxin family protein [Bacteroidales bacterium]|nr:thioredoxin family protein [Bacteroidales bacterium]
METVISHSDFLTKTSGKKRAFLLLYKPDNDQNICAFQNIENAIGKSGKSEFFSADVSVVKDIHQNYGVTTVPSLLVFENNKLTGIIKGCHDSSYYKALTENTLFKASNNEDAKSARRVTVYSTPACSWCNTLKTWLHKNNVKYSEIDISRDQKAAEDLIRRSGQQGVPQTDINGSIIVGFDQPKLKQLLGIQ